MRKGFTLIELLLTLGIVVILSTIGVLSLVGYRSQQSLRAASQKFVTFARDVQQKSISQEGGLQWGVRFTHQAGVRDSYQLINGVSTFNPAGSLVALPSNAEFAVVYGDLVFNRLGLPLSPTTLIMRLKANPGVTRTITINAQGLIREQ